MPNVEVTTTDAKPKQRFFRRPLLQVASVATAALALLAITYAVRYYTVRAKLDAAIAEARAKGEPVWFSDLDPGPGKNPSDDANELLALCRQINLDYDDRHRIEMATLQTLLFIQDEDVVVTPEDYARLAKFSNDNAELITGIRELVDGGTFWFEYDYHTESPLHSGCPHEDLIGLAEKAFAIEMIVAFREANESKFIVGLTGYLRLARVWENDPMAGRDAIAELIRNGLRYAGGWSKVAPWSSSGSQALELCLDDLEPLVRTSPTIVRHRAAAFTTLSNLENSRNSQIACSRVRTPKTGSELVEFFLPGTPKDRQVDRWVSHWYRPWLLNQQTHVFETMARQIQLIDKRGVEASKRIAEIDQEIENLDMPLSKAFLRQLTLDRLLTLHARQSLVSAEILLRLSRSFETIPQPPGPLVAYLEDSIKAAPLGFFSDRPLQYEIDGSTIAVFDDYPGEEGQRAGSFYLQLAETPEVVEAN